MTGSSDSRPTAVVEVPPGYQCPLCSCRAGGTGFRASQVARAAICEGCSEELSYFLENDERPDEGVLERLEATTGHSFRECRLAYYREAVALFRWMLAPEHIEAEVAEQRRWTGHTPVETVSHWQRALRDYEQTLQTLESR